MTFDKVLGRGPKDAKILCLGEEPGYEEFETGKPFVGPTGQMLINQILSPNGILEREVYFDNVTQERTRNKNPTDLEILDNLVDLRRRIFDLKEISIIIAIGSAALKALSVFERAEITKYRGYFFRSRLTGHLTIPITHPSWIMQGNFSAIHVAMADVSKVKGQSCSISRLHEILSPEEAILRLSELVKFPRPLVCDIETTIPCIGFAIDKLNSFTIPFDPRQSKPTDYELRDKLNQVFKTCPIITQNGLFDKKVLVDFFGLDSDWQIYFDTMYCHQLLYPDLPQILKPHSLAFLTSIYTNEPFYKDEGRKWRRGIDGDEQFFTYNGKDCCVTYEIYEILKEELAEQKQEDYFYQIIMPIVEVLFSMHRIGVPISPENLGAFLSFIKRESTLAELKFIKKTSRLPPNVRSSIQMETCLSAIGIKEKDLTRSQKTRKVLSNENIVRNLYYKTRKEELLHLLRLRELGTLCNNFSNFKCDPQGRYHADFKFGPKSGRLACSSEAGPQLQNLPRLKICRNVIGPKGSRKLVKGDLAQAEARLVAYIAPETALIKIFESSDPDIYAQVCALQTGKRREEITKESPERAIFKEVVLASNYGLGARKLVEVLREGEIFIKEKDAKIYLQAYFDRFSGITRYHREIQAQLRKDRTLVDLFGRKHILLGAFDDKTFRSAYSRIPQSTVAGILFKAMLGLSKDLPKFASLILQVHDELVVECDELSVNYVLTLLKRHMEIPLLANNRTFTIPVELSVGSAWGKMEKINA